MALKEYADKRHFDETPEPPGKVAKSKGRLRFVVQKHAASRLHYDFRLELNGVLKSWAIPKGPSLNTGDKRLAMMVEDHPMDYRTFEGIIPKGNYGAGTVMVWDQGWYEPARTEDSNAERALNQGLQKGDLKFKLHGEKINGEFALVKIKAEENSWLLIKKKDEYATDDDVTALDRSALSGRTLDEISRSTDKWPKKAETNLEGASPEKFPSVFKPMLATLADQAFDKDNWLFEIKWDGYRIGAFVQDKKAKLLSRKNQDYSKVFEPVAKELQQLQNSAVIDGEMVVVDEKGRSSFQALQNYQKTGAGNLVYYAFDITHLDGYDLTELPLRHRKEILRQIIAPLELTQYSDHIESGGKEFLEAATRESLEGIMGKEADSAYLPGRRSRSWLKLKAHQRQEAVIGGYTEPRGSRKGFGALVLGVYKGKELTYIGHTGGGFNDKLIAEIYPKLRRLERKTSPFNSKFKVNAPVHWVTPSLVAEIKFQEWTDEGIMRQPIFIGLREDKPAKEVTREDEVSAETATEEASHHPATSEPFKNLDKIFWPKEKYTKGDLIEYYRRMAPVILPYLKDRPESMNRFPNGIAGESFFQKDVKGRIPHWIETVSIYSESNDKHMEYLLCQNEETLLYMANLGCIELNPWHSRVGHLDNPDYLLIDLDAKTCGFETVIQVAQKTREILDTLRIPSYPKTSGKTGLHICVPLGAKYDYNQAKQFTELLVRLVHEKLPDITSVERTPAKRQGKIYLDYLQNRKGQTMAVQYCLRPVTGAPVSTPLKWEEVKTGLNPLDFNIKTIFKRLDKKGDLWEPVLGEGVNMASALKELEARGEKF